MNAGLRIALGTLFLTATACRTRTTASLWSDLDFVCVEVRETATQQVPEKMSYAYMFKKWAPRDILMIPYRATLGGSGPFQNKAALLMPVPGSPLRVKIWAGEQEPVEFRLTAPTAPYEPSEWLSGVPARLELRSFRCPTDGKPVRACCQYFPGDRALAQK